MFETDLIIWMQQNSPAWMLDMMLALSELGSGWIYMPIVLVLMFGVRIRPGLGVLLALLLAGVAIGSIKDGVGFPRPSQVDARVLDKGESGEHIVVDGAGSHFWDVPSDEAVRIVRESGDDSSGFISGHTTNAMAVALSLLVFFAARSRLLWGVALLWPVLMGVSRMFLGRHFLADVLGGLLAGMLCVWLARRVIRPGPVAPRALQVLLAITIALGVIGALLVPHLHWLDPGALGPVCGALASFFLFERNGYPTETGERWMRIVRVVLALVAGYGTTWLSVAFQASAGIPNRHPATVLVAFGFFLLAIPGTMLACRALRLYGPSAPARVEAA